jgi:hypothetical protein
MMAVSMGGCERRPKTGGSQEIEVQKDRGSSESKGLWAKAHIRMGSGIVACPVTKVLEWDAANPNEFLSTFDVERVLHEADPNGMGWDPALTILCTRSDGRKFQINVDPSLECWDIGGASQQLDPRFRHLLKAEYDRVQDQKGDTAPSGI